MCRMKFFDGLELQDHFVLDDDIGDIITDYFVFVEYLNRDFFLDNLNQLVSVLS